VFAVDVTGPVPCAEAVAVLDTTVPSGSGVATVTEKCSVSDDGGARSPICQRTPTTVVGSAGSLDTQLAPTWNWAPAEAEPAT